MTILVYGYSTVILDILSQVAKKYRISVVTTECRPFGEGYAMARDISDLGLPCRIITDNAVVAVIENIDFVVVGAEAVMENGGIINRIGTHNLAIISKAFNTPFYVFAESLKFLRFFPLS